MSSLVITVKSEQTQAVLQQLLKLPTNSAREEARALAKYFEKLASLNERGVISVQTGASDPVAASGTLTLVSAIATDAVTVGGTTFTATSTPTLSTHWEIDGASDTLDATSLKNAINAHATVSLQVLATSSDNVVTITARTLGNDGNLIPLTSADATITASGSGFLAGGTGGADDAASTYTLGI